MLIVVLGFEEEAPPDNYYADSYDDGYSPSPPHTSGGAYYPESNAFPPPPVPQAAGYAQHPNVSVPNVNDYPVAPPFDAAHPPYDPAHPPYDAAHQPYDQAQFPGHQPFPAHAPPPADPYGYPAQPREARDGGNVSSPTLFAPIAQAPQVSRNMYNVADEEGAS
jgi:hypothetical protein